MYSDLNKMHDTRFEWMNLAQQENCFYRKLLDQLPIGIALIHHDNGTIVWKNTRFHNLVDGHEKEVLAKCELISSYSSVHDNRLRLHERNTDTDYRFFSYRLQDGKKVWLRLRLSYEQQIDASLSYGLLTVEEVSALKGLEEDFDFLKYHDRLTGLHNRTYFELEKQRLDQPDQLPLSVIVCDINGLKMINETWGFAKGDHALLTTAHVLKSCCRKKDLLARTSGDEFSILLPGTDAASAARMRDQILDRCAQEILGVDQDHFALSVSTGCATKDLPDESLDQIIRVAANNMLKQKLFEQNSLHHSILSSIKATMHEKSHETREHCERLALLARQLGSALGLPKHQLQDLELLAHVHDIGKIIIDDSILNKPDTLTPTEWIQMKKHPEIGYRIAIASFDIRHIADSILNHHERWDGHGYPRGLSGKQIPKTARILGIVDAYDAMTHDRPYRKALTKDQAIQEIKENAGTQFDPEIAEAFIEQIEKLNA
jgi:diguanylate cyclase (GGDEF)-like protein/PAS domain S-box-containing protein